MASAVAEQHIRSNYMFQLWDHDPGDTSADVVTPDGGTTERWVDMADLSHFAVACFTTILGGNGPTLLEIVAADDTSGTNATQIKSSGTIAPDALGDWAIVECNADEIAQLSAANGYTLRYVAGRITCNNAGDEAVVLYFGLPKRRYLNQTPATTIS